MLEISSVQNGPTELAGVAIIRCVSHPVRLFITAYGLTMVANRAVFQPPRYARREDGPKRAVISKRERLA